jgi:hypothetical protein
VKFQLLFSVDRMTQLGNFKNLLELNQTIKYGGHKLFVSRVPTKLINSVLRLRKIFLQFLLND